MASIQNILPKALATLARPTPPSPVNIHNSHTWLAGCGWALVGNETKEEEAIMERAFEGVVEWFAALLEGQEPRWLTLVGPSGLGKTLLVKRICAYVWEHGRALYDRTVLSVLEPNPIKRTESQLYYYRQQGHPFKSWDVLCPVNDDNRERLERCKKNWFSAIDELKPQTGDAKPGQEAIIPKPFEVRAADDLVNHRLRKWTVITSNLLRPQIAACWDVRIASRLTRDGNVLIDLTGVRDFGLRLEALAKASPKVSK